MSQNCYGLVTPPTTQELVDQFSELVVGDPMRGVEVQARRQIGEQTGGGYDDPELDRISKKRGALRKCLQAGQTEKGRPMTDEEKQHNWPSKIQAQDEKFKARKEVRGLSQV